MLRTRPLALAIALCLPALLCATAARADRRTLIRGYEYATQPQGNLELEIWNELDIPRGHASDIALTQRIELEYGITDHWDVALYHVFADQGSGESRTYGFDSWRLEQRYRLLEKGDLPVDLMLYLEIERPRDFTEPWIFEGKLIAERELGKLGLVGNLIFERGASTAGEMNFELDLGARYEVHPTLRLGAEFWSTTSWEYDSATGDRSAHTANFVGPSLSVATGKFWLQLGAGFGLGDARSVFARSVLGMNL